MKREGGLTNYVQINNAGNVLAISGSTELGLEQACEQIVRIREVSDHIYI